MAKRRQPPPEELAARGGSQRSVTFRLHASDHEALVRIARRAKVGHTTLARRIVEDYVRTQARPPRR